MRPVHTALIALCLLAPAAQGGLFVPDSSARRSREFDVVHYRITVAFDEEEGRVRGTTIVRLTPLLDRLDSVVLDAADMAVAAVTGSGGCALPFRNASPRLTLFLDRTYSFGETLSVGITYTCVPRRGLYFVRADSALGRRHSQIWTQGEDMDNHYWFPCYDYPNDKATSEVIATVREEYTLLSNGRLAEERHDTKARTRTFHWVEARPHASYLIMVAAGRYAQIRAHARGVPLTYYVYPEDSLHAGSVFGATPAMMAFFEEWTGMPYPWEKFAQIIIDDFMWGGMENTSAVTLNTATMADARARLDFPSEPVVAHELAHQWWGDIVTCRDWTHLWLQEGFATYFEALYRKAAEGEDEFQYAMITASSHVRTEERNGGRSPVVSASSTPTNLYQRGAWVLHMLRSILGDGAFRRGMNAYLRRFAFGNADTDEFRLALEDATGQNLEWFFDQWLYGTGFPELRVTRAWDDASRTLALTVEQTQTPENLLFRFPLRVQIVTPGGELRQTVEVRERRSTFHFPLAERPLMVIADKGYLVLKEMTFPKTVPEYLYQLAHAEDVADRIVAAQALSDSGDVAGVCDALAAAASGDRFWGVRQAALAALRECDGSPERFLAALADSHPAVRNEAAKSLAKSNLSGLGTILDSVARHDPSYVVAATCVVGLATVDSIRGFILARDVIGSPSYRSIMQGAALVALKSLGEGFALALPLTGPGEPENIRTLATEVLGVTGRGIPKAKERLAVLLGDLLPGVRMAAAAAAADWDDPALEAALRSRVEKEQDPAVRAAVARALSRRKD
jgi:aminopeptidase N